MERIDIKKEWEEFVAQHKEKEPTVSDADAEYLKRQISQVMIPYLTGVMTEGRRDDGVKVCVSTITDILCNFVIQFGDKNLSDHLLAAMEFIIDRGLKEKDGVQHNGSHTS